MGNLFMNFAIDFSLGFPYKALGCIFPKKLLF